MSAVLHRPETRLLTLTGPGGVGKTRLALQVAAAAGDAFPDGGWFVGLGAITDPDLVAPTVAKTLNIREASDQPIADRLRAALCQKRLLLVLDNFEQVASAAPLVADLLGGCPELTVLITSRMRLRVSGEQAYAVTPLRVMRPDEAIPAAHTSASDAMRLFVARARAVKGDFALNAENAEAVSEICTRLDGLPLAIELAAAWVKVLSPQVLLTRLERRLPLLTGGNRDAPARQQTMRDTIAWSHDLLSPEEQILFRRLALFVGGFTLEAAEAVGGRGSGVGGTHEPLTSDFRLPTSDSVLDLVASLVDKSLLQWREAATGAGRFAMLETVREFARERLVASGEAHVAGERHAAYYLHVVERVAHTAFAYWWVWDTGASGEPLGPTVANERVAPEYDNVRAALNWLEANERAEEYLRLTTACVPFWEAYGHYREAAARLERALALTGTEPALLRAQALLMAGDVAIQMGDLDAAWTYAQQSLAISKLLDQTRGQANALHNIAIIEENRGNWERATELFEESLEVWRRLEEPIKAAGTRAILGGVVYAQGQLDRAVALEEEALRLFQAAGDLVGVAMAHWYLGLFAASHGDALEAARRHHASLEVFASIDEAKHLFKPLIGLAALAAQFSHFEASARLIGAADHILQQTGGHLFPFDRPVYEQAVATARAGLGVERFTVASQAAGRLTPMELLADADAVVAAAVMERRKPRRRGAVASFRLSPREAEVLQLLAADKTDREIAEALCISRRTVNAHVASILARLNVGSRHDAVARARELALLPARTDSPRGT